MPARTIAIRELLGGDDAHGTSILLWALDALGPDLVEWHPATVRREIEEAGGPITGVNFDRLMAAVAILTTDLFFRNAGAFTTLATALCGGGFHPNDFTPPDAAECAWAITEALLLSPPDEDEPEPFSEDVRRVVGHVLHDEGFLSAPDILGVSLGLGQHRDRVRRDYGDDPELTATIAAGQRARMDEITHVIRDGLDGLLAQIESLPLREGDASGLAERLRRTLHATHVSWEPQGDTQP